MRNWIVLGLLSLLSGAAAATYKVGVITSMSGKYAQFGAQQAAGYAVALAELNRKGGNTFEMVLRDDGSDAAKAVFVAQELADQGVPLILGTYASGVTKAVAAWAGRAQVPLVVVTSTDDAITKPGNPWVFRINQPSAAFAGVVLDVLGGNGVKTFAMISANQVFEQAVHDQALYLAPAKKLGVVGDEVYQPGETDFRPALTRLKAKNPDALFLISAGDAPALIKQAREIGLRPKFFVGGGGGFALGSFLDGAAGAAENVLTATAWTPTLRYPGTQKLYVNLQAALSTGVTKGEPAYQAAQAYAGMLVAGDALTRAGGADRAKVRASLDKTDLSTAYGPVKFENYNGYTNQNALSMIVAQVRDGKFRTVWPTTVNHQKINPER